MCMCTACGLHHCVNVRLGQVQIIITLALSGRNARILHLVWFSVQLYHCIHIPCKCGYCAVTVLVSRSDQELIHNAPCCEYSLSFLQTHRCTVNTVGYSANIVYTSKQASWSV